jgi:hypothetical protein
MLFITITIKMLILSILYVSFIITIQVMEMTTYYYTTNYSLSYYVHLNWLNLDLAMDTITTLSFLNKLLYPLHLDNLFLIIK